MRNEIFKKGLVCAILVLFIGIAIVPSIHAEVSKTNFVQKKTDNIPPVADAGGPYKGKAGEVIVLDGSDSYDPDGTIGKWYWYYYTKFGPIATLPTPIGFGETIEYSWDSHLISFIHLCLRVTDNDGATDCDETIVIIKNSQSQSSNQQYPQSSSNDQQNIPYAPLFCEPAHGVIGDFTVESGQAKDKAKDIPSHERPRPILDVEFLSSSRVKITNIGTATAYNVHIKLELQGGFVLIGRVREIVIDEIEPDESVIRDLGRVFGFGHVTLVLSLWADNVPKVEGSIQGILMGFFLIY